MYSYIPSLAKGSNLHDIFFKHANRYLVCIKHSYMLKDITLSDISDLAICCTVKAGTCMSTLYKLKRHYLN